ncbi:tagatose kinase [Actibacterium lipolyticum]|uniref:2-dehydro-3-deoxygluconokinase n=1 Tax=Actibacterium lipolyticum TaxID=1524263 RepID=A0A238JRK1_9RHOB|nr:sugar kinase [Actibacterium lipolyticum]SMX33281.1 2-dehydro-3-deoxygluconokinase [Actibacterium lipolyticum]
MTLAPDTLGPTVSIGEILAEIVGTTVGDGLGETQPLSGPYPSGAPAIFVAQCGRIGGSAAMIGTVGDDAFGRLNIDRLQSNGVDVSAVRIHPDLPTGTAFVRYQNDGSRDFIFNMWSSAAGDASWTPEVAALVARAGHLHVMGTLLAQENMWQLTQRAAKQIKARGGTVSLDPNLRKELTTNATTRARLREMVALTDVLLPSGDELFLAADITPDAAQTAALDALFARGISEVVLKQGAAGSICFAADGTTNHAPGLTVTEIDPTGAGDCFGGAYVACRRLGMPIKQALIYANAAGARNVTMRGPMEGAGTREELDNLINETKARTT